jgi:hypothetical protein
MCIKPFDPRRWLLAGLIALAAPAAHAQVMIGGPMIRGPLPGGAAGQIQLPYTANDGGGSNWYIYNDGALRQQGGQPIYIQGGLLTVDGMQFNVLTNTGRMDAKTGELILENPQMNNWSVTRRILIDKDDNFVRYVDVFHNGTNQDRTLNVELSTMINFGIQQNQMIADPKHKDRPIAWTAMTGLGKGVLEVFGGSSGKVVPQITYQPGGNMVEARYSLSVPAGKDAAIMHLHLMVINVQAGEQRATNFVASKLLKTVPTELRRAIGNFPNDSGGLLDLDILRGDVFDVVELRGGDQYRGTIKETDYKLQTFYGPVDLSPDRVVAIVNAGQFKPRQLLVTSDGQIFGGHLAKATIDIELSSGQVVSIPLDQVSRVGYRKRADEASNTELDKPMVQMRGGDRVAIVPPAGKIEVATRYGLLSLDPAWISQIVFQSEDDALHDVYLTDGSKLTGLVQAEAMELNLSAAGTAQTVHFPLSGMARLQLTAQIPEADADGPQVQMINGDLLCGSLEGQLKLQTAFDTITLDGSQIAHMARGSEQSAGELQVALWDGSMISGQLTDPTAQCRLLCGAELNVPIALIEQYTQPHPRPSADMVKQIQATAADLGADDWRQRDRAQATLNSMGPAIIGVLRELKPKLDTEAQQRIDSIIKKLETPPARPPAAGVMQPGMMLR